MPSRPFERWPLRHQVVLVAGTAILLFGLGAAEFVRQNEMRAFERTFRAQSSKLVGTLAASSLDAVLSNDRPVLDNTIESLVAEDPEIGAVTVRDDRGEIITEWSRSETPGAEVGSWFEFRRDVTLDDEVYGSFEVSWNVSRRTAEIKDFATRIYLYAAGISLAIALLLLGIVEALMVRPVSVIHDRLRALDGGAELPALRLRGARELTDIAATVDSLGDLLALKRAKEAELEAVSRQKSEFLANMSHELRTPMNGVLGMLSLVSDSRLDASQAEQVRVASASGRNLLRLINDILDFSKVEAGRLEFESIAFDLETLIDETTEVLSGQAHAKGLLLACRTAPDLPVSMRGDPTRLRQVLVNLTGNAIKFTASGRVDIEVGPADAHGPARPGSLRFEVRDTGVGIPDGALDTVFESFAQADGSTTRNYGGTGLGLAISRQLIEGMGGSIGVTSSVGEGSTFWFELDFGGVDGCGSVAARARAALAGTPPRRVVIANSDPGRLERMSELCTELGMTVDPVADSEALLGTLRAALLAARDAGQPPPTLLFDVRLAGLPAPRLLRLVEADPAFDDLVLVPLYRLGDDDGLDADRGTRAATALAMPVTRSSLARLFAGRSVADPSHAESDAVTRRRRARFGDFRVLVVEDNPVNQEVALGMLARIGVQSEIADNGRAGLERLREGGIDAVLMDCQMPVMDGYATTRALRELEAAGGAGTRLPIVALTANAMDGDVERCLEAGMDDYLAKPFDPDRLEEALMRWLPGFDDAVPDAPGTHPGGGDAPVADEPTDAVPGDAIAGDSDDTPLERAA